MIKKGTFIEIEYTGIIKETNKVFDTTSEEIAKKENIYNPKAIYKPIIICLGENQILPGLDKELQNKKLNKKYEIELPPEKAFGKKNPKLLHLISLSKFKKQNITLYIGMQVNIDNLLGTIKTLTSGRAIIDFNHPLAGRTLIYKIKINKEITQPKIKLDSLLSFYIKDFKTEIKNSTLTIKANLQEDLKKLVIEKIKALIPEFKEIVILKE